MPALSGPCYRLVASGTLLGWRGGSLAAEMVSGDVRHYCLGGCNDLLLFVWGSWQVRRAGRVPLLVALPPVAVPPSRPSRCLYRVALYRCPLSLPAGTPFHAVYACRELGPVAFLVRAKCPLCLRVLAQPRCSRLPPPPAFRRAPLARLPPRTLVGPFQVVHAPTCLLVEAPALLVVGGGGHGPRVCLSLCWRC